ncbi:MAG: hypothetical protein HQL67_08670 [Magnetococcales bacterium]|nr:hypothetical protein [Magnetococcales bacterium]
MSFWQNWQAEKRHKKELRTQAMAVHDRLVERVLALTKDRGLGVDDDYDLRFDVMVFLTAFLLYKIRDKVVFSQELWEITFEGFQESLRLRGVTDIRMAARMKQTMQDATGRRNIYIVAWENQDQPGLRRAVGRNILNGAIPEDERINQLLKALEGFPDCVMQEI